MPISLLREQLFAVSLDGGDELLSLPGVLHHLCLGDLEDFCHLRPHQVHGWMGFLVQLAAGALFNCGASVEDTSVEFWETALSILDDSGLGFGLITELGELGFMQPKLTQNRIDKIAGTPMNYIRYSDKLKKGFNIFHTPDALDYIVYSQKHDVKGRNMIIAELDMWVYALVSFQTMNFYNGKKNFEVGRNGSGYSSRPYMSLIPDLSYCNRFKSNLAATLEARDGLVQRGGFAAKNGILLSWLPEWPAKRSLKVSELDPLYIDTARRVKLIDGPIALGFSSTVRHVDARRGVEDIWLPRRRAKKPEKRILYSISSKFSYRKILELFFLDTMDKSPVMLAREDSQVIYCQVQSLGQGKVKEFHERVIDLPEEVKDLMLTEEGRQELLERANRMIGHVDTFVEDIMKPVLRNCLMYKPKHGEKVAVLAEKQGGPTLYRLLDVFETYLDTELMDLFLYDNEEGIFQLMEEAGRHTMVEALKSVPHSGYKRAKCRAYMRGLFIKLVEAAQSVREVS